MPTTVSAGNLLGGWIPSGTDYLRSTIISENNFLPFGSPEKSWGTLIPKRLTYSMVSAAQAVEPAFSERVTVKTASIGQHAQSSTRLVTPRGVNFMPQDMNGKPDRRWVTYHHA